MKYPLHYFIRFNAIEWPYGAKCASVHVIVCVPLYVFFQMHDGLVREVAIQRIDDAVVIE